MPPSGAVLNMFGWLIGSSLSTLSAVLVRSLDILLAPTRHTEMLWIVVPLAATLLATELYFSVYADEDPGWNSATFNMLFLVLVSLDLLRKLFTQVPFSLEGVLMEQGLFALSGILLATGLVLFVLNFTHALPKRLAFSLSSTLPVNLFAYVAVAVVYTNLSLAGGGIPLDAVTGLAAAALFLAAGLVFGLAHLVLRHRHES